MERPKKHGHHNRQLQRWPSGRYWGGAWAVTLEDRLDSNRAEMAAITLALIVAHQQKDRYPNLPKIALCYDSLTAGHTAAGLWDSKANRDLRRVNRALAQALQSTQETRLHWQHVKSHQGHPWNEAADVVAREASMQNIPAEGYTALLEELGLHKENLAPLEWWWFWTCKGNEFTKYIRGTQMRLPLRDEPTQLNPETALPKMQGEIAEQRAATLTMSVATMNVLTLYDTANTTTARAGISARMEAIARQCEEAEWNMVGLQETRSRSTGYFQLGKYHVLAAAASTKGHHGVQLWIAQQWETTEGPLHLQQQHLRLLVQEERFLAAEVRHPTTNLVAIVAHAPSTESAEEASQWWANQLALIPTGYKTWDRIILTDANARVGSITSPAIGALHPDVENAAGTGFHRMALDQRLWAANTWPGVHDGQAATWRHPNRTEARLDYILLPNHWKDYDIQSRVDQSVDITTKKTDHRPVVATIQLPTKTQIKRGRIHPQIDNERIKKQLQNLVREGKSVWPQRIQWEQSTHDQAHNLTTEAQSWLQHNGQTTRQKRKPHMTEERHGPGYATRKPRGKRSRTKRNRKEPASSEHAFSIGEAR